MTQIERREDVIFSTMREATIECSDTNPASELSSGARFVSPFSLAQRLSRPANPLDMIPDALPEELSPLAVHKRA